MAVAGTSNSVMTDGQFGDIGDTPGQMTNVSTGGHYSEKGFVDPGYEQVMVDGWFSQQPSFYEVFTGAWFSFQTIPELTATPGADEVKNVNLKAEFQPEIALKARFQIG